MWYVIQTTSGTEQQCLTICKARIDACLYKEMFVPMYIDKMHFKKKWHDIKKPLFPGYFFIDTDDIEPIVKELGKVDRLTSVLRNAEQVSPIREEEQRFLQSMMNEEHIIHCSVGLIVGDKICITDGPLRNHYGLIKKVDRHRRIAKLEIDFFGRLTPAEVGLEILARLSEEEFQRLKEEKVSGNAGTTKDDETKMSEQLVKVKSGVFAGMQGILLSSQEEKDEWRVKIELFDNPTEVVFSKEEIVVE